MEDSNTQLLFRFVENEFSVYGESQDYYTLKTASKEIMVLDGLFQCTILPRLATILPTDWMFVRKKEKFEDTKRVIRRTDNTIANRKSTKGQTMIYKTLHRKLKVEQHEPH